MKPIIRKATVLSLLALATSALAHADGLVANSCGILTDTAKAKAEQQAKELWPHIVSQTEPNGYDTPFIGAQQLKQLTRDVRDSVSSEAYALSRDLSGLRERIADHDKRFEALNKERADSSAEQTKLYSAVTLHGHYATVLKPGMKKKDAEISAHITDLEGQMRDIRNERDQLAPLAGAAEAQLKQDMSGLTINTKIANSWQGGAFNSTTLTYQLCAGGTTLSYDSKTYKVCATLDLAHGGDPTYELDASLNSYDNTYFYTIAELGTESPQELAKDFHGWAKIKHGLRKQQIEPMPEICKHDADELFEHIAETEGFKRVIASATPAPTASVTGGTVSAQ